MEPFRVHILGCGSALPTLRHFASSQIIEMRGKCFMVDCGEGTQISLRRSRLRFTKLQAVFISHLHGDHCFGLIGMVSTFGMLGRVAPLGIYAPAALEPLLRTQLDMFCPGLGYEVVFHAVDTTASRI
ncbi:MAG: MBL fold metallo-hydrolase, partial [Prevotella sp.]